MKHLDININNTGFLPLLACLYVSLYRALFCVRRAVPGLGVISRRSETVVSRSFSLYSLMPHTVRKICFSHSNYNEKLIRTEHEERETSEEGETSQHVKNSTSGKEK